MGEALEAGLIERNPVRGVEFPESAPRDPARLWNTDQLRLFLRGIETDELYPVFVLMAMRGLRRGETLGMRWCDLDLEQCHLHVRQQLVAVAGSVITGPPKSAAGRRTLVLDPLSHEVLKRHQAAMRRWSATYNIGLAPADLVFLTAVGKPWKPAYVTRKFGRLVGESGLPRMRLHDLRHLSATLGLQTGESLKEVQARLGHSSIAVTMNTYTEVTNPLAKASADKLAQAVLGDAS
jgi:integrase